MWVFPVEVSFQNENNKIDAIRVHSEIKANQLNSHELIPMIRVNVLHLVLPFCRNDFMLL